MNPAEQNLTLKRIDQRQDLILEDLDRLNQQITNIIELYSASRTESDMGDETPAADRIPANRDAAA